MLAAASEPPASALATLALEHNALVLGERHRRPESTRLFLDLVEATASRGACPVVGLEIAADEQPALDALVRSEGTVEAVRVFRTIDHAAYRNLLARLAELARTTCVDLVAIDATPGVGASRDERMAARLAPYVGRRLVLALVGRTHALRRIEWYADAKGRPPLAERLAALAGRDAVVSILQEWPGSCDGPRTPRLAPADSAEGAQAVSAAFRVLAAVPPMDPAEAADLAVIWECSGVGGESLDVSGGGAFRASAAGRS